MEWNEVLTGLLTLNGKPVYVGVSELGGAGAEVASFSGPLAVTLRDSPGSEDERFALGIGADSLVFLERALFDGGYWDGSGAVVTQATVKLTFEEMTR